MKRYLIILLVFAAMGSWNICHGNNREDSRIETYRDSVSARFGIELAIPEDLRVCPYYGHYGPLNWTVSSPLKPNGYPLNSFDYLLESVDGTYAILLEQLLHYDSEREVMSDPLSTSPEYLRREVAHMLHSDMNIPETLDSAVTLIDGICGCDRCYFYEVPEGASTFCYIIPPVDKTEHPVQALYKNKYGHLYRICFTKQGRPPFSIAVMATQGIDVMPMIERLIR